MRSVEASAKTRKEAIQNALNELGVELHDVSIDILDEGSRGIFGLGARNVKVRVSTDVPGPARPERSERSERGERGDRGDRGPRGERHPRGERSERGPRPERPPRGEQRPERRERPERGGSERRDRGGRSDRPAREKSSGDRPARDRQAAPASRQSEEPRPPRPPRPPREPEKPFVFDAESEARAKEAAALLSEIIKMMGMEATVASAQMEDGYKLVISSPDSAILIGRKGRNLSALQYLLNRMITSADSDQTERMIIDIEDYLDRRKASLEDLALRMADKAKSSGRDVRLKPLSPHERRTIHVTLQDDPEVRTFSLGDDVYRTMVISPKRGSGGGGRRSRRGDRGDRRNGDANGGYREPRETSDAPSEANDESNQEVG